MKKMEKMEKMEKIRNNFIQQNEKSSYYKYFAGLIVLIFL